jgi:uracil phosphoribosyltransferase
MADVHVVDHPLVQDRLARLRNEETEPKAFREIVRDLGLLMTYEATRDLRSAEVEVFSPMGPARGTRVVENIGLVPMLRAGLAMAEGAAQLLPDASTWHIGLYRDEATLKPVEYYLRHQVSEAVNLCLVLDPMLATGGSAIATIETLKGWGARRIRFVGVIAASDGVQRLSDAHPDVPIYVAAVDPHLNDVGFIVPGLGDAGDRQFGT